jgi:hypothetical protein
MEIERYEHKHLNLICELDGTAAAFRAGEWADLKEQALEVEKIDGGVRVFLPAQSAGLARDLARREAQCCGFLDISVMTDDNKVRMDITCAVPVEVPLISFLGNLPVKPSPRPERGAFHGQASPYLR